MTETGVQIEPAIRGIPSNAATRVNIATLSLYGIVRIPTPQSPLHPQRQRADAASSSRPLVDSPLHSPSASHDAKNNKRLRCRRGLAFQIPRAAVRKARLAVSACLYNLGIVRRIHLMGG